MQQQQLESAAATAATLVESFEMEIL